MRIAFLDLNAMHAELRIELDAAWRQMSRSGQFIGGEFVEQFEAEWAEYCGTKYCVGLMSPHLSEAAVRRVVDAIERRPGRVGTEQTLAC
jgi:hypothetical protein